MSPRSLVFAAIGVLVIGAGWYLFRPERLFINQKVDESLVATSVSPAMPAGGETEGDVILASGSFHKVARECIFEGRWNAQRA